MVDDSKWFALCVVAFLIALALMVMSEHREKAERFKACIELAKQADHNLVIENMVCR
jgi:hypothetical protein